LVNHSLQCATRGPWPAKSAARNGKNIRRLTKALKTWERAQTRRELKKVRKHQRLETHSVLARKELVLFLIFFHQRLEGLSATRA